MPVTLGINKVPYTEFIEGTREIYRAEGNEAVRVLDCPWNRRDEFRADMLGYPIQDLAPPFAIHRRLPEPHPEIPIPPPSPIYQPNNSTIFAVEMELLEGIGVPDINPDTNYIRFLDKGPTDLIPEPGVEVFGKARFAVTYRWLPFDVRQDGDVTTELDRFVERRATYASQEVEVPGKGLEFNSDSVVLQVNVSRLLFRKELSYIWYQCPKIPEANIRNCIGKVNSVTFDANGVVAADGSPLGYPAGTLLMIGNDYHRYNSASGDVVYDIVYKFIYRQDGWNVAIRPNTGEFEAIRFKVGTPSAGQPAPYKLADFATLFAFV
jgi:hypothetical protein